MSNGSEPIDQAPSRPSPAITVRSPFRTKIIDFLREYELTPEAIELAQLTELGPDVTFELLDIAAHALIDDAIPQVEPADESPPTGPRQPVDEESDGVMPIYGAIKALGELRVVEALPLFIQLIRRTSLDEGHEDVRDALIAIGEPAIDRLIEVLHDQSLNSWARNEASKALAAIAERYPTERDQVVGELISALDQIDTENYELERFAAFVISDLADLKATEAAPSIERLFRSDAVDPTIVDPGSIFGDLGLAVPEGLESFSDQTRSGVRRVTLTCSSCHRTRHHIVRRVYYDRGSAARASEPGYNYSPVIIPARIVCPRCGAVDQYTVDPITTMGVSLGVFAKARFGTARSRQPDDLIDPMLSGIDVITFTAAGREMHPFEAIEWYRTQIEKDPTDAELRTKLGNIYRFLQHPEEATAAFEAALAIDPDLPEPYLNLGVFAYQAGDIAIATERVTRALELYRAQAGNDPEARSMSEVATGLLVDMAAGRPIELTPAIFEEEEPEPSEHRTGVRHLSDPAYVPGETYVRSTPKIGRNDPCYCGSGKKYKKCHGA